MYLVSFNINSIRARIAQLKAISEQYLPAVIGLQETKVQDLEFPIAQTQRLGYETIFHGQKGQYGVALMTNLPILKTIKGLPGRKVKTLTMLQNSRLNEIFMQA